ncbi:MAG: hypothetical protein ACMUIG_03320 [Thermoplasmatota archaeon]
MKNFEIVAKIKDLQAELNVIKEEEDILHVQLRTRINEAKSVQERRDELNQKVKELSQKPRELLGERKEIWDDIKETSGMKREIIREIQPYLKRIGELRNIRDDYNRASRGLIEKLVENYESTRTSLLESDINLKNELYLYQFLFELRDRIYAKNNADRIHSEIVRIKEVDLSKYNQHLSALDEKIGEMKEKSHTELQEAKGLWSERDMVRDEAQKYHQDLMEINKVIRDIKRDINRKRKEKREIIRRIEDWRREFKKDKSERDRSDKQRKLKEALSKYKRGESLSLDEMGLLLEAGEIK